MTIPPQSMEIERIFSHLSTQGYRSVAITASNTDEGVTSVTLALAQRYLLSGLSALVVDLNLYRPSLIPMLETYTEQVTEGYFSSPQLVGTEKGVIALTGIAAPEGRDALVKLRHPGVLRQCIQQWHQQFDVVLFDTSPLNRINASNLPAERTAVECDATLLVVLANKTTKAQVSEAVERLTTAGAHLTGSILNDRYNPCLKHELIRQIKRLDRRCKWLSQRLQKIVNNNRLLTLDI